MNAELEKKMRRMRTVKPLAWEYVGYPKIQVYGADAVHGMYWIVRTLLPDALWSDWSLHWGASFHEKTRPLGSSEYDIQGLMDRANEDLLESLSSVLSLIEE